MNLAEFRESDNQRETENESTPLNINFKSENKKKKKNKRGKKMNNKYKLNFNFMLLLTIIAIMFLFFIYQFFFNLDENISQNKKVSYLKKNNSYDIKNISSEKAIINNNQDENKNETKEKISSLPIKNKNQKNNTLSKNFENQKSESKNLININARMNPIKQHQKPGLAFIYHILHSNGVARVIALTADYLIKTGKYNVYLITGKPFIKDYKYDHRIKRFIGHDNYTIIKSLKQSLNIKYFILNNQLTESLIRFLKGLNSKVIGIFHGVYLSAIFHNTTNSYRSWYKFDIYDAFISVIADDLYIYKKLGFKHSTFIPNLYTFEPSETPESNLTYNNIVILGRAYDTIKGSIYALKAMSHIAKEIQDAKLIFATSDTRIKELQNLSNYYNISNNVIFQFFPNITEIFLNSSVLMFTSLCEAFPMAMNEGKAYGLPVVAFNVPFSPPYQSGVIIVPYLDVEALAKETIKLLKDYNYRKKMGKEAKLSLNRFKNNDTVQLWEKLFDSLDKGKFNQFQKEIEDKYYNEKKAKEHLLMHYNNSLKYNKHFRCHTFENMTDINYIKRINNCTNFTSY